MNRQNHKISSGLQVYGLYRPAYPPNSLTYFIRLSGRTEIYLETWSKGGFEDYSSSHKATTDAVNVNSRWTEHPKSCCYVDRRDIGRIIAGFKLMISSTARSAERNSGFRTCGALIIVHRLEHGQQDYVMFTDWEVYLWG